MKKKFNVGDKVFVQNHGDFWGCKVLIVKTRIERAATVQTEDGKYEGCFLLKDILPYTEERAKEIASYLEFCEKVERIKKELGF